MICFGSATLKIWCVNCCSTNSIVIWRLIRNIWTAIFTAYSVKILWKFCGQFLCNVELWIHNFVESHRCWEVETIVRKCQPNPNLVIGRLWIYDGTRSRMIGRRKIIIDNSKLLWSVTISSRVSLVAIYQYQSILIKRLTQS